MSEAGDTQPWSPGSLLLERYEIERDLGGGGFGHVVLVHDIRSGQRYAVKRVYLEDHAAQARFLDEVQLWRSLAAHPHLVECFFPRVVGEVLAVFSEYVDGGSLADWIADGRLYETPTSSLARVLTIAIQAARGIDVAHHAGLLHLDVKPANVLLTRAGVAKIADFGLALARRSSTDERIAEEQVLDMFTDIGLDPAAREALKNRLLSFTNGDGTIDVPGGDGLSLLYASPEQARGDRLTRAADVWSWAVTTLEMFARQRSWHFGPDAGAALDALVARPDADLAVPIPPEIVAVLGECLHADPARRSRSLRDVADRLAEVYGIVCGQPFVEDGPRTPAPPPVTEMQPREAGGDMKWGDPRVWLDFAYAAADQDPEAAVAFWPSRQGPLDAQIVEELRALLEARRVLAPVARNPDLLVPLGHLQADIGRLRRSDGDEDQAIRDFEAASETIASAGDAPVDLARILTPLAGLLREVGRREEARIVAQRAVALCRDRDLDEQGVLTLATALTAAAPLHDDVVEAVRLYDEAIRLYDSADDEVGRASTLAEKAGVLQLARRDDEAAAVWAQAHEAFEDARSRGVPGIAQIEAMALRNRASLADSFDDMGRYAQAAVDIYWPLVTERRLQTHSGDLGECLWLTGRALEHGGRVQEAIERYGSAREFLERAVVRGGQHRLTQALAEACDHEATLVRDLGDPRAAVALARRATEMWERLVGLEGRRQWGAELASARVKLASCLGDAGEPRAGLEVLDEVVRLLEHEDHGLSASRVRQEIAEAHSARGVLLRQIGQPVRAVEAYQAGIDLVRDQHDSDDRRIEAMLLMNMGNALIDAGDFVAAIAPNEQSVRIWERLAGEMQGALAEGLEARLAEARDNLVKKLFYVGEYGRAEELCRPAADLYRKLIGRGRSDLEPKLVRLTIAHAVALERLLDLNGAIAAMRAVRAGLDEGQLQRLEWLEALSTVASEDVPRWLAGSRHTINDVREMLREVPAFRLSESLEDVADRLCFVIRRHPVDDAFALCAEAAAGAGLLACAAGRPAAARAAFETAIDSSRVLVKERGYLDRLRETFGVYAAVTLSEADDADARDLVAALDGRPPNMGHLMGLPWTVAMSFELTNLRGTTR